MKNIILLVILCISPHVTAFEDIVCPDGTSKFEEQNDTGKSFGCNKLDGGGKRIKHGPYKSYYLNGTLEKSATLENGQIHGSYEEYFKDGHPKTKEHYDHGELDGESLEYYSTGALKIKETYKKGNQDGEYRGYYANGQLRLTGKNSNGKHLNSWESWDHSGRSLAKGTYEAVMKALGAYDKMREQDKPLMEYVLSPCYKEQITAMQSGKPMANSWIPKPGAVFRANDQFYTIKLMLNQSPVELLVEGPGQFDDSLKNACFFVLVVKDTKLLKSTSGGLVAKIGDTIHSFALKSVGPQKISLQRLKDISSTDLELPVFELISPFGLVQGK